MLAAARTGVKGPKNPLRTTRSSHAGRRFDRLAGLCPVRFSWRSESGGAPVNGWRGPAHGAGQLWQQLRGASGGRAGGPGANLPQDAVYPSAFQDVLGCPEKW